MHSYIILLTLKILVIHREFLKANHILPIKISYDFISSHTSVHAY